MPTPILVGVGQYTERIEDPENRALSVVELEIEAALDSPDIMHKSDISAMVSRAIAGEPVLS
jgi:hypothetical protein